MIKKQEIDFLISWIPFQNPVQMIHINLNPLPMSTETCKAINLLASEYWTTSISFSPDLFIPNPISFFHIEGAALVSAFKDLGSRCIIILAVALWSLVCPSSCCNFFRLESHVFSLSFPCNWSIVSVLLPCTVSSSDSLMFLCTHYMLFNGSWHINQGIFGFISV